LSATVESELNSAIEVVITKRGIDDKYLCAGLIFYDR